MVAKRPCRICLCYIETTVVKTRSRTKHNWKWNKLAQIKAEYAGRSITIKSLLWIINCQTTDRSVQCVYLFF